MTNDNILQQGKQETKIVPDVLYDFSAAVMGNYCRTQPTIALQGPDGNGTMSWLEAYQNRQGAWKLFNRYKDFSNNDDVIKTGTSFETVEIHPDNNQQSFTMIDVLTRMAEFEKASRNEDGSEQLLLQNLAEHSLEKLGTEHYIAFGMRECIAFDEKTGRPVPSFEGRIMGEGSFTDEMENAIKTAWVAKVEKYGKEGSYLDALQLNGKPVQMLDELYANMGKQRAYDDILNFFEENIFTIFEDCDRKGFDHPCIIEREGQRPRTEPVGVALELIIRETLNDHAIENSYGDVLSEDELNNIRNILVSLDIFRTILHARWSIDIAVKNPELTDHSEEFVQDQILKIQDKYRDHDLQEIDINTISSAILDRDSAQAMTVQKTIQRIRQDLIALKERTTEKVQELQKPRLGATSPLTKGPFV